MVSRIRSWLVSTTSTPSRSPARTKRRARRSATSWVTASPAPAAAPTVVTGSGRPPTAMISSSRRASSGRRSTRAATIWSSVTPGAARSVLAHRDAVVRARGPGELFDKNGLPPDSRAMPVGGLLRPRRRRTPRSASASAARRRASSGPTASSRASASSGQRARISARNGLVVCLLVAVGHHEQERRRVRRAHQLEEQRRAVDVAPLHVVDEDDQRLPLRRAREELAQRGERALAHHLRIARGRLRERPRCRPRAGGPGTGARAPRCLAAARAARRASGGDQVAAERVDDAVDGLVGTDSRS